MRLLRTSNDVTGIKVGQGRFEVRVVRRNGRRRYDKQCIGSSLHTAPMRTTVHTARHTWNSLPNKT